MRVTVDLQMAVNKKDYPEVRFPRARDFQQWINAALHEVRKSLEMTLRIVDETEIAALNLKYRNKRYATNVLAFPFEPVQGVMETLLGDVVICAPVVAQEAVQQGKDQQAHWAHLSVHGTLHLLGYDHENAADAGQMEAREVSVLAGFNFPNPYYLEQNDATQRNERRPHGKQNASPRKKSPLVAGEAHRRFIART